MKQVNRVLTGNELIDSSITNIMQAAGGKLGGLCANGYES
jgi:hypothetical protein